MPRISKKVKPAAATVISDMFLKVIPLMVMLGYGDDMVQCRTLCKETFVNLNDDEDYNYGTVTRVLNMSENDELVEKSSKHFYPLTAFFLLRRVYFNHEDIYCTFPLSLTTLKIMIKHRMLILYNILWKSSVDSPLQIRELTDATDHYITILKYGVNIKIVIPKDSMIIIPDIIKGRPIEYDPIDIFIYIQEAINGRSFRGVTGHPVLFDVIKDDDIDNTNLQAAFILRDCLFPPFDCSWEAVKKQYVFGFDFFCSVLSVTTMMVCVKTIDVRMVNNEVAFDVEIKGVSLDVFSFFAACCSIAFGGTIQAHDLVTFPERNHASRAERLVHGYELLFDELETLPLRYSVFFESPFRGYTPRTILHFPRNCSPLHWLIYGGHFEGFIFWLRRARFHKDDPALINMPYTMAPWLNPTTPMQLARMLVSKITRGHILLGTLQTNRLRMMWHLYDKGGVEMRELLTAKRPTGLFDESICDELTLSTGLTRFDYETQRENNGWESMYETTPLYEGETHLREDGQAMAFYPFYGKRPEDEILRELENAKAHAFTDEGWARHDVSD
jgi:hypothetical protein